MICYFIILLPSVIMRAITTDRLPIVLYYNTDYNVEVYLNIVVSMRKSRPTLLLHSLLPR